MTIWKNISKIFALENTCILKHIVSLAFTHKKLPLDLIGVLHIPLDLQKDFLSRVKKKINCEELFYLTTCNRVEFVLVFNDSSNYEANTKTVLLQCFDKIQKLEPYISGVSEFHNKEAVRHLMSVAASVDSLIVGEREIISQVRSAYEHCNEAGLTQDTIRLLIRTVIENAKKVYAQTSIAKNPVSIVSLAFRELKSLTTQKDARILVVGAGSTNKTFCRFLVKYGFENFYIFNRSLSNAKKLANEVNGQAYDLKDLHAFNEGFDVLIACTSSDHELIDIQLYEKILNNDRSKKIIIDLGIPRDVSTDIINNYQVHYISIDQMKKISSQNLKIRKKELEKANLIIEQGVSIYQKMQKEREVEIAMRNVPEEVKKIKRFALNELYRKDLQGLDHDSREIIDKVLGYMEKKYISGPMKMAKEIILSEINEDEIQNRKQR